MVPAGKKKKKGKKLKDVDSLFAALEADVDAGPAMDDNASTAGESVARSTSPLWKWGCYCDCSEPWL